MADDPLLQLLLEPAEPIEIAELTATLNSLGRRYQSFAVENQLARKATEARLLVNSVSPGSIDISFLPDYEQIAIAAGLLTALIDKAELIAKFASSIKGLLDHFKKDKADAPDGKEITVKDCDDAINILKPIAKHGGFQTFNTINGERARGRRSLGESNPSENASAKSRRRGQTARAVGLATIGSGRRKDRGSNKS